MISNSLERGEDDSGLSEKQKKMPHLRHEKGKKKFHAFNYYVQAPMQIQASARAPGRHDLCMLPEAGPISLHRYIGVLEI
jgi:hypothetical protein